jgi:hypothetical protein
VSVARAGLDVKIHDFGAGAVSANERCIPLRNGDQLCEDFNVIFFAAAGGGENVVYVEHFAAFIHPDGSATEFIAELGIAVGVSGSYDRGRLSMARSGAATVPFYDLDPVTGALIPNGRVVTLGAFEWIAVSDDVYVFGNDGPFAPGLPHLVVDRCVTQVNNNHNRFRTARATGTIDGVPVDAYGPSLPSVARHRSPRRARRDPRRRNHRRPGEPRLLS